MVSRARAAAAEGHAELVLTGVDLGSYGRDLGSDLAALVRRLLDECDAGVRVRLSSINANDVPERLIELNRDPRLCGHWHIPLQSGSDRILRAMHRGYRRRHYLRVVEALRRRDPDTELTTDVMVGFPGESDADHEATLQLIEEVEFLGCHVFRYSPRPGTGGAPPRSCRRRDRAEAERRGPPGGRGQRREAAPARRRPAIGWSGSGWRARRHGLSDGYHEVVAVPDPASRAGGLQSVLVTGIEGDRLRGVIVPTPADGSDAGRGGGPPPGEPRAPALGRSGAPLWTTQPPVEGAANTAVLRLVAAWLGVAPSRVRLIAGHRHAHKLVEVEGVDGPPT